MSPYSVSVEGRTLEQKAATYNRIKRRLGYAELVLGVGYLIALLLGWPLDLGHLARARSEVLAVQVLVYFLAGAVIFELITLPLAVLSGYFVEKWFGLLNQEPGSWTADLIKAQLIGLVLGSIAVEILYLFIRLTDRWWWLPAGAAFALFFILLAQLAPVVLLPLFFKFKKLPDNELNRRLGNLCQKAGTKVLGIYEWGLAAKTNRANAALVGWGPTRRAVLSDSLISGFTVSEVEVVLAHELGHHKMGHLWILLFFQCGVTFLAFLLADFLYHSIGPFLGLSRLDEVAGLPLLALAFLIVGLAAMPAANAVSRGLERKADLYALRLTGLVGSFISTMERLAAMNLSELTPHPVIEFLFHSHPSPASRIKAAMDFRRDTRRPDEVH
ncbi:MAG: M48 family metallopeptidase [Thermodesulfobacteriota bacterium]